MNLRRRRSLFQGKKLDEESRLDENQQNFWNGIACFDLNGGLFEVEYEAINEFLTLPPNLLATDKEFFLFFDRGFGGKLIIVGDPFLAKL